MSRTPVARVRQAKEGLALSKTHQKCGQVKTCQTRGRRQANKEYQRLSACPTHRKRYIGVRSGIVDSQTRSRQVEGMTSPERTPERIERRERNRQTYLPLMDEQTPLLRPEEVQRVERESMEEAPGLLRSGVDRSNSAPEQLRSGVKAEQKVEQQKGATGIKAKFNKWVKEKLGRSPPNTPQRALMEQQREREIASELRGPKDENVERRMKYKQRE